MNKLTNRADADQIGLGALLAELGEAVQRHLVQTRDIQTDSQAVGFEGGDTIFAIDRKVEPIIAGLMEAWPESLKPIVLIAEGFGRDGRHLFGDPDHSPRYRLLIDPIDGTRNLMYDKRAAWFLASIAPDRGEQTSLSDSVASVMIELPTSKQLYADTFICEKGTSVLARRKRIDTGIETVFFPQPSQETTLLNGFAQVANFFPGTKELASQLMERIAEATLGVVKPGQASIFDDQYISTGGQLVELLVGHDRFCCDLRPLFYDILTHKTSVSIERGLECHPYDMAGMLVAQQVGVILTDGWGKNLDAPFDVSTGIHWCGYANSQLRAQIEPVIHEWLSGQLR